MNKYKLLNQVFLNTTVKYLSSLAKGFFVAYLLGPSVFGVWKLMQTLMNYLGYSNLGMDKYIFRELPLLGGSKKSVNILKVVSQTFSITLISSLGVLLVGIVINQIIVIEISLTSLVLFYLWFVSQKICEFYLALTFGQRIYEGTLKSENIYSGSILLLVIIFPYLYGLNGVLITHIIANLIWLLYLSRINRIRFKLIIDFSGVSKMIRQGVELLTYKISYVLLLSISTLVISFYYDIQYVGYWGLAMTFLSILDLLPGSINRIIETDCGFLVGQNEIVENSTYLLSKLYKYSDAYFYFFYASIFLFISVLPIISLIFNEYILSFLIIPILSYGYITLKSINAFAGVILSNKKNNLLVAILLGLFVCNFITANIIGMYSLSLVYHAVIVSAIQIIYAYAILLIFKYYINIKLSFEILFYNKIKYMLLLTSLIIVYMIGYYNNWSTELRVMANIPNAIIYIYFILAFGKKEVPDIFVHFKSLFFKYSPLRKGA